MCRVLIIDDEKSICRLLISVLLRDGIIADMATNGRDGLHKFNQGNFDIVITDMVMPGMDGNSIARKIRQSDKPDTPIIGISGTSWLLDESEFDFVIEKPFSIHSIAGAVKSLAAPSRLSTA